MELIKMEHEARPARVKVQPFDWFVCSVFGYLCFCCTGICAMYYAVRANHAVDCEKDPESIQNHTKKAKTLTIMSIIIGCLIVLIYVILIIVMVVRAENARSSMYDRYYNSNYPYKRYS